MFYENPNISYKHEGWFSKLFPSLDISLFICKKLPYTFDLVHSIDTILCSDIGRQNIPEILSSNHTLLSHVLVLRSKMFHRYGPLERLHEECDYVGYTSRILTAVVAQTVQIDLEYAFKVTD
jgi:hypothetical protein